MNLKEEIKFVAECNLCHKKEAMELALQEATDQWIGYCEDRDCAGILEIPQQQINKQLLLI